MAIILNSGTNPAAIMHNNGTINKVLHASGSENFTTVWDNSFPEIIENAVRAYNSTGGYDIYLRGLTKSSESIEIIDGVSYDKVEYSTSDLSIDLKWSNSAYRFIGTLNPLPSNISEVAVYGYDDTFSGGPTGYTTGAPSTFSSAKRFIDLDLTYTFEFKHSANYTTDTSAIAAFPSMLITCKTVFFQSQSSGDNFYIQGISASGRTSGREHFWIVPTGLITQTASAKLTFRKQK